MVDLRCLGALPPLPRPLVGGADVRCGHRSEKNSYLLHLFRDCESLQLSHQLFSQTLPGTFLY
jgi:hypothetical protein